MNKRVSFALALGGSLLLVSRLPAGKAESAGSKEAAGLSKDVLALFQDHCVKCHGPVKPRAKLNLANLEGISRGSTNGPVVSPGKPEDSLLWQLVQEAEMPPKKPLSASERFLLRRWIERGAPGITFAAPDHWAFRVPVGPYVPPVRQGTPVWTPIDQFISAALQQKNLILNPPADRATLIRRVSFHLTGLPPTPAEIDAFLADRSAAAYERMVERYLNSPHYGERWGKYWLDAAGYADSNGYFNADSDRPLAYRYRDYVIRSFNQDKPHDRFVQEQLAGDELAGYVPGGDVTAGMVELLTATHFLRNAPDGTGESDGNPDEVRTDRFTVLEGNLQNIMNCLLGITIQCARCHGHKFEPIRHEEYYRLQAILYPAYCPDRWIKPNDRIVAVATRAQRQEYQRQTAQINRQIKALQAGLATMAAPLREQVVEERLQSLDPAPRARVLEALATPPGKRSREQEALLKKYVEPLKITDDDLARRFPEYAAVRDQVRKTQAARDKARPRPLDHLAVLVETDPNPPVHHLLRRGQHNKPGPKVEPGVPAALCTPANVCRFPAHPQRRISTGRRGAFAHWVTSPQNPLFARVMVNRIWQHYFGVGLVATPDNLGKSGARPTHPELLDYLATEFVRSGWSVKTMHRLILTSAVYRQASKFREDGYRIDPTNRLLWRFPLRRLDAEALRDAMLAVAGELDWLSGGPYVPTRRDANGSVEVDEKQDGARRRSVYLQQRRTQVLTLLQLFDAPAMVGICGKRTTSTVPLQSLALLNSDFARARARAFARHLQQQAGHDEEQRITLTFRVACGRQPRDRERAAARRFLAAQQAVYAREKEASLRTWTDLCQMVLASNAFLYVE
jgi:hypothetical protein